MPGAIRAWSHDQANPTAHDAPSGAKNRKHVGESRDIDGTREASGDCEQRLGRYSCAGAVIRGFDRSN